MFYFKKTPSLIQKIFSERIWRIDTDEKILYFTFDDGPHPDATSFVLEELKRYNAKATFFCVGRNVKENFAVYERIISEGHRVGNHTFNHLNGWKTNDKIYVEDIAKAAKIIDSNLFRPPYGKITGFQAKAIQGNKLHLKIIMWEVLSGDFDPSVNGENCYLNVVKNAKPGSVVVFHDSVKSLATLQHALPRLLKYYNDEGYFFQALSNMI
jgi:peptidoglycan/xylan/chitin deacetylase (PgdA/CDA1 family)